MWFTKKILRATTSVAKTARRQYNVTVVGGTSDVGQTLCLLLRSEPYITQLTVYDMNPSIAGIVMDLSHIPAESTVKSFKGEDKLLKALCKADLVLAVGGITGETCKNQYVQKKNYLQDNIDFIKKFSRNMAKVSPMPFIGIATEPINMCVPIAAEIIKSRGDYEPRKLFGITGIDSLRAEAIYSTKLNVDPSKCTVPVIGGHSEHTMIPLWSQATPERCIDLDQIKTMTAKVRNASREITDAKSGYPPSLSMAHSILLFTRGICDAISGKFTPIINAFVENNDFGTSYFAGRMHLTAWGAKDMQRYENLSEYECDLLQNSITKLREEVMNGRKTLEFE